MGDGSFGATALRLTAQGASMGPGAQYLCHFVVGDGLFGVCDHGEPDDDVVFVPTGSQAGLFASTGPGSRPRPSR